VLAGILLVVVVWKKSRSSGEAVVA